MSTANSQSPGVSLPMKTIIPPVVGQFLRLLDQPEGHGNTLPFQNTRGAPSLDQLSTILPFPRLRYKSFLGALGWERVRKAHKAVCFLFLIVHGTAYDGAPSIWANDIDLILPITTITPSSDAKLAAVKAKCGFHYMINYKTHPNWSEEALRLTNGQGADYVLENGGPRTVTESLNSIRMGVNVSVIGFLSQAKQMPDVAGMALGKGAVLRGVTVGSTPLLREVVRFLGAKCIRIPVDREFGFDLEGVVEGLKFMASGGHVGKVCIRVVA
ncbi:hypothetical protein BDW69DRAFT_180543 [Aspergillus filifer]